MAVKFDSGNFPDNTNVVIYRVMGDRLAGKVTTTTVHGQQIMVDQLESGSYAAVGTVDGRMMRINFNVDMAPTAGAAITVDPTVTEVVDEDQMPDAQIDQVSATRFRPRFKLPRGKKGDKGEAGEAGTRGDVGAQGVAGPPGPKGDQGSQGVQGEPGPQGDRGPIGSQGPEGERGLQGAKGDKGDPGAQGPQGAKGDTGPKGDTGATGAAGAVGAAGAKGDAGAAGAKGDTGAQGSAGLTKLKYAAVVNTATDGTLSVTYPAGTFGSGVAPVVSLTPAGAASNAYNHQIVSSTSTGFSAKIWKTNQTISVVAIGLGINVLQAPGAAVPVHVTAFEPT